MACLTRHYTTAIDDLPVRILAEFDEQPGLRLTSSQVRRLWDISESECSDALAYLVTSKLLRRDATGRYCLPYGKQCIAWIAS